jgi:hypothetical protein
MSACGIKARILTGLPAYDQDQPIKERGHSLAAGSGPTAALTLLAYYDARFGYRQLLTRSHEAANGLPEEPLLELRRTTHTLNDRLHGRDWGMTLPVFFQEGLQSYIANRYGWCVLKEYSANVFGRGLASVYEESCDLIDAGKPHVLVMDWHGANGILPHQYMVVTGWRADGGRRHLIANAGWGAACPFVTIDMDDKRVRPATLYYIESIGRTAAMGGIGQRIGPAPQYRWDTRGGVRRLAPAVRKHFSEQSEAWEASHPARELIAGTDFTVCEWG